MELSRQEELLCAIFSIASILCFASGFDFFGYLFAGKAALDCVSALVVVSRQRNGKTVT